MRLGGLFPARNVGQKDAGPHDVLGLASGLLDRRDGDLKAALRLSIKIAGVATLPSAAIGAVPETAIWLPTRTAREKPILGSNGEPDETSLRDKAGSFRWGKRTMYVRQSRVVKRCRLPWLRPGR